MHAANLILFIHLLITCYLLGMIWLVQRVHYPAFRYVDRVQFTEFAEFHGRSISWIVAPAMLLELLTGIALILTHLNWLWSLNLLSILLLWCITFFWSVPCHQKLAQGFTHRAWTSLIHSNAWRTALWSLRAFALSGFVFVELSP
ncbi:MAG: hypothetical protein KDC71_07170 [Acidobacteria bacterium]|nr:hypothetical protein [Acidobacteriota bacterium]